jgi:octaprenyl-diphosphate synthase
VTLPLIYAASAAPELFVALVARVRTGDTEAARTIAERVRASGAPSRVRELAQRETAAALGCLEHVPSGPARDVLADVARGLSARVS